jgi:nitrate/TMAO reductase-like tetraheme cytochrome c subunit
MIIKRFTLIFSIILLFPILVNINNASAQEDVCIKCHLENEGELSIPVKKWEKSVHKKVGVTCVDCHGGNPKSIDNAMDESAGFIGKPKVIEIPFLCAKCHANIKKMRQYNIRTDQFEEYKTSVHGKRLLKKKDTNVATCVSCHGSHEIRKKNDPLSTVYHTNVPETCGKCHSDPNRMKPYGLPYNQLKEYKKGYHGKILYGKIEGKNPSLAPNCADCHGIHGATPPGVKEIANVCGNCHSNTAKYYKESPHYKAMLSAGVPQCISCHGNHKNQFPTPKKFIGEEEGHCGSCHEKDTNPYILAQFINLSITNAENFVSKVEGELYEAKESGKNIEDLELKIIEAKNNLTKVGPVTHTLNSEKIKKLTDEALKKGKEVEIEINKIHKELRDRKMLFVIVVIFAVWIAILLLLKLRSLSIEKEVS